MLKNRVLHIVGGFIGLTLLLAGIPLYLLIASMPQLQGESKLSGLVSSVTVNFDRFAIPTIRAESRVDAFRALGYITAQDRLFQMDLMRRKNGGRLAEIFGEKALKSDIEQRFLELNRVATEVIESLPDDEIKILRAYAGGVNSYINQANVLPFEFILLGYEPELWKTKDSILVAMGLFQVLSWTERDERMLSVMNKVLADSLTTFLTPDTDDFSAALIGGDESHRPKQAIPVVEIARINQNSKTNPLLSLVRTDDVVGSNSWAVSGLKTTDGRAILANDMHLKLGVPNIWYRANLIYHNVSLSGVMLPGVPLFSVGSNGYIAWGFTNALADVVDLIYLQINPVNANEYLTPNGWKAFEKINEVIQLKGDQDFLLERRRTIWGPVSQHELMGRPVALRWTALDPNNVNLDLSRMDRVTSLEQGIHIMNHAGLPPMNAILADNKGRIAWTVTGKIPIRKGYDGSVTRSWANGNSAWVGYIPAEELPRLINPPSGYLATANNRTMGKGYRYSIGHNFAVSYRAYQINDRLRHLNQITETAMFDLQLDTTTQFYAYYKTLALSVLTNEVLRSKPDLVPIRRLIKAWNGKADADSQAFGLLTVFRLQLADTIISPLVQACRKQDPNFNYRWFKMDTPLRQLLSAAIPDTLPNPSHYTDWNSLILENLENSVEQVKQKFVVDSLAHLTWGRMNTARISHPFSSAIPSLSQFLDMPVDELSGCAYCIRVSNPRYGASERMVISPGKPSEGILHMPAGQSGHPLSPHYADQHPYWVNGESLEFMSNDIEHTLMLIPN